MYGKLDVTAPQEEWNKFHSGQKSQLRDSFEKVMGKKLSDEEFEKLRKDPTMYDQMNPGRKKIGSHYSDR